ncbi:MAG: lipopolysaccharide biosynthesis protein [Chloroflexi bacterium]|nr:lipopolysaccharide biosynthesis protein [Chloroflexota bacterium]
MTDRKTYPPQWFKFSIFSRLGKEFSWILVGQGAAILGGLIGLRWLTDVLSPTTFGEIALIMTIATLVNQIILGPLAGAALRFLSPAEEDQSTAAYLRALWSLIGQVSLWTVLATAVISSGLALFGRTNWAFFLVSAMVYALFTGYNQILNGMQNALRQRKIVAWHAALGQWLQVALVLLAVIRLGPTSGNAMLGYAAAAFLVLPSQTYFFRRKVLTLPGMQNQPTALAVYGWRRKLRDYALPISGWGVFTWVQMSSDRWALQISASTSSVGYFAVLYRLGYYPITLVTTLVTQLITPILFQKAGDATDASRMKTTTQVNQWLTAAALAVTVLGTGLAYFLHGPIFNVLVAAEYRAISWLLPWIILGGGLFATGQVATISLLSEANTKRLIAPKIGTAVCATSLNFAAAHFYGLPGVIFAGVVSGVVYIIWILALVRHNGRETGSPETQFGTENQVL